jgi:hypothetical protein
MHWVIVLAALTGKERLISLSVTKPESTWHGNTAHILQAAAGARPLPCGASSMPALHTAGGSALTDEARQLASNPFA